MLITGPTPSSSPQGECLPPRPQKWGLQRGRRWEKGECNLACISHRYVGFMEPGQQEGWPWHLVLRTVEYGYDTALSLVGRGPWAGVIT